MRTNSLSAVSAIALVAAMNLWGASAFAQDQARKPAAQAQDDDTTDLEEVVITGSFIRGKPEDAPQPVTAVTLQDMEEAGSPTAIDLIKNLTESGAVAGEFNRYLGSTPPGAASVNLRSLGQGRTVVLLNGKRLVDQRTGGGPSSGRFNNVNTIPTSAVGRVEVLRDGGAVTYGADAVGGVVNYITRKIDGAELKGNYRIIDGSDGDWDVAWVGGRRFEGGNFTISADYQHRSPLMAYERDFARTPVLMNNTGFVASPISQPGSIQIQTYTTPGVYTNVTWTNTANTPTNVTGVLRDPSCLALGGFATISSNVPSCLMSISQYDWLVEEQDMGHVFGEFNYEITPALRFHADATFFYQELPKIHYYPSDQPQSFPTNPASLGGYAQRGWYSPGTNPAVRHFVESLKNANGTNAFTNAQIANVVGCTTANLNCATPVNPGRMKIVSGLWKLLGAGGDPRFLDEDGTGTYTSNSRMWRGTAGLSGELPKMFGLSMDWDASVTGSVSTLRYSGEDVLTNRVATALAGFGGANCAANTFLPGDVANEALRGNTAAGCYYLNPFGSAIEKNIWQPQFVNNVSYVGTGTYAGYMPGMGLQNNPDVIDWLYEPIYMNRKTDFALVDLQLNGSSDFELPGGPIDFALGGQFRYVAEKYNIPDIANNDLNPCPTPGAPLASCSPPAHGGPGATRPFAYARLATTMGISNFTQDPERRFPVWATFAETRLPILSNLDVSIAGRWEKFVSDRSDIDQEIFVPAASLKWQMHENLAFRATYGENFRYVDPPTAGGVNTANATLSVFGNSAVSSRTSAINNVNIRPETGFNYNAGLIFSRGGTMVTLDYWGVQIDDYVRSVTADQIAAAATVGGASGSSFTPDSLVDQSSGLLQTNAGLGVPIVQVAADCFNAATGAPTVAKCFGTPAGVQPGLISYYTFVNSGSLKTSGVDLNITHSIGEPVFGGDVRLSAGVSLFLNYELGALVLSGEEIAKGFEGLASYNEAPGKNGQHQSQWRGNVGVNYRHGRHNVNWNTHYVSSMYNDNAATFSNTTNLNLGDASNVVVPCTGLPNYTPPFPENAGKGLYGAPATNCNVINTLGMKLEGAFNSDFSYRYDVNDSMTVQMTVQNVFGIDPNFSRNQLSYDSTVASPLGRTIRVGFTKRY